MQEIIGSHDDILFDLEQIKLLSQKEVRLTGKQRGRISRLPRKKRDDVKKEILSKKEREKKTFLRIWTLELEDKVKRSNLPPEIVSQILELTTYAKDRDMTFIYNIEKKIDAIREQVRQAEQEETRKQVEVGMKLGAGIAVAAVAAATVGAFVQAPFNKEEFEKKTVAYHENKIISDLVMAAERPIAPAEPVRTYPTKQGSKYPESHYRLEKKHKDEWMDVLVRDVQKKQKEAGKPVQTPEEIAASFESMHNVKKRVAMRALALENPELAARQKQEEEAQYKVELQKGIERLRRKHQEKAKKMAKFLAKQQAKEAQAKEQKGALKTDRVQSRGPRVAEREKTERPPEIKQAEQQKTEQQKPAVAKAEDKGPETGRLFNQGLSKRLDDAERVMKAVHERVVQESREKMDTPQQEAAVRKKINEGKNKKVPFMVLVKTAQKDAA